MITLDQAKELQHGTILYHARNRNADGTPQRWKVNGKVKVWKRSPDKVEVPLKHGLRDHGYLLSLPNRDGTHVSNLNTMCLTEDEAIDSTNGTNGLL